MGGRGGGNGGQRRTTNACNSHSLVHTHTHSPIGSNQLHSTIIVRIVVQHIEQYFCSQKQSRPRSNIVRDKQPIRDINHRGKQRAQGLPLYMHYTSTSIGVSLTDEHLCVCAQHYNMLCTTAAVDADAASRIIRRPPRHCMQYEQ